MITNQRGSSTIEVNDILTNQQMKDIRRELLANRFFNLNKDLSDQPMEDNSTEKLKVSLGFLQLETEGYGITNKRFRNIVKEIEKLIATHR